MLYISSHIMYHTHTHTFFFELLKLPHSPTRTHARLFGGSDLDVSGSRWWCGMWLAADDDDDSVDQQIYTDMLPSLNSASLSGGVFVHGGSLLRRESCTLLFLLYLCLSSSSTSSFFAAESNTKTNPTHTHTQK